MSLMHSPSTLLPPIARRDSRLWVPQRIAIAMIFLWMMTRWVFANIRQLVPDEAYYWTWSRHPALSYFDHPPMTAYFIRLGTAIVGNSELGVRCWAGVLTAGTIGMLAWITGRITRDSRAAVFVILALIFSPAISVIGVIVTPDTPLCFFSTAALTSVLSIFTPSKTGDLPSASRGKLWLLFGAMLGLALDSKYTAVLLGVAVLAALLTSREGRSHLSTPWPWLGALVSAMVFSPVIWWNATHVWASFKFQLHHGLAAGQNPVWKNFLEYTGGQFAVCTPVLFIFLLVVLTIHWRRRDSSMVLRILLFSSTLPLLFFAYSGLHKHVEANWPLFAYLPGMVLIAHYLSENWTRRRTFWAEVALKVALVGAVLIHLPEAVWAFNPRLGSPLWDELFGWRELGRQVELYRLDSPVFTTDYQYASELSFYLPGQPMVCPLPDASRPTAFDFFPEKPQASFFPRVLVVRRGDISALDLRIREDFQNYSIIHFQSWQQQRTIRISSITVASKQPVIQPQPATRSTATHASGETRP